MQLRVGADRKALLHLDPDPSSVHDSWRFGGASEVRLVEAFLWMWWILMWSSDGGLVEILEISKTADEDRNHYI